MRLLAEEELLTLVQHGLLDGQLAVAHFDRSQHYQFLVFADLVEMIKFLKKRRVDGIFWEEAYATQVQFLSDEWFTFANAQLAQTSYEQLNPYFQEEDPSE